MVLLVTMETWPMNEWVAAELNLCFQNQNGKNKLFTDHYYLKQIASPLRLIVHWDRYNEMISLLNQRSSSVIYVFKKSYAFMAI